MSTRRDIRSPVRWRCRSCTGSRRSWPAITPARWPTGNRSRRKCTALAAATPSGNCSRNRWSPVIWRSSATTMRCASCSDGSSVARHHATFAGSTGRGCHDRVCYAAATRSLGGDQTMIDGNTIRHLWTHKTQDHPWLSDEELVIDRAEGVWVWTQTGKKLLDGFAGLAVVNVVFFLMVRRPPRSTLFPYTTS